MSLKLVPIMTVFSLSEAYLIKGKLEAEGIPAFIFDDQMVGVNWLYMQALGGIRVMIANVDVEKAREILDLPAGTLESYDPIDICPKCSSTNITQVKTKPYIVMLIWMILGFLFLRTTDRRYCNNCHHEWTIKK